MTIVEQHNKHIKRNIGLNNKMNEKTASNYFMSIVYLVYIIGFGTGLACSNLTNATYLIGIAIILAGMLFAFMFTIRLMKGGYKLTFVQTQKDIGGET